MLRASWRRTSAATTWRRWAAWSAGSGADEPRLDHAAPDRGIHWRRLRLGTRRRRRSFHRLSQAAESLPGRCEAGVGADGFRVFQKRLWTIPERLVDRAEVVIVLGHVRSLGPLLGQPGGVYLLREGLPEPPLPVINPGERVDICRVVFGKSGRLE